tara:strand:+ start:231 stop:482 length:252 start_codon:yes stop_codon:yes gene_type:complete
MADTKIRSALKALTWRVIATLTTTVIVLILTSELHLALTAGALDISLKLIFYYLHERSWDVTSWGKDAEKWERQQNRISAGSD